MKAWNGEDILISKSYLLLFKNMIVTIQEKLSNDFKFDEDVENLNINITKKLVKARKNEDGEFRLLTYRNDEFSLRRKHLGALIMEKIFEGVKNSTNFEELKIGDPKISTLEIYITHSNEHLPALHEKHEAQKRVWDAMKEKSNGQVQIEDREKLKEATNKLKEEIDFQNSEVKNECTDTKVYEKLLEKHERFVREVHSEL